VISSEARLARSCSTVRVLMSVGMNRGPAETELADRERRMLKTEHNHRKLRNGYAGPGVDPQMLIPPT
jgi:hypothetical protein